MKKTYNWNGKLSNRKATNRIILHHAESKSCTADVVYFAPGWKEARGCRIEHECAKEYGMDRIE